MERFVRRIIAGGGGLLAGLWLHAMGQFRSLIWILGVVLVLTGTGLLASGIAEPLEY